MSVWARIVSRFLFTPPSKIYVQKTVEAQLPRFFPFSRPPLFLQRLQRQLPCQLQQCIRHDPLRRQAPGLRAPGAMGNALGIVSGLILGQSAVSADIVSPLLLIVVAASGLGGFCIPNYALSVGMKIIQLLFLTAGALGGLYLMALLGLALLCAACAMRSVGSPLTAPLTPRRPGNPDLLIRFPLWRQKARAFFARQEH